MRVILVERKQIPIYLPEPNPVRNSSPFQVPSTIVAIRLTEFNAYFAWEEG